MGKLIIENVIIEKSNKDIKTGVSYEFGENLNLICGNNEAGKSSLMKFIKEGLFKTKGIDTGRIFFSISNKHYRADIKDSKQTDSRLKIFDENNNLCEYNLIENNLNQKYFEQGFTINLDDLMSVQNKNNETLINTIKDPSSEYLTDFISSLKQKIKQTLGDNGRLVTEPNKILEKISSLNIKINELSNIESEYNHIISKIDDLNNNIKNLNSDEDILKIILEIQKIDEELHIKTTQKQKIQLTFNPKLSNNNAKYFEILQEYGKYEINKSLIETSQDKYNLITENIKDKINQLKHTFSTEIDEDIILNLNVDFDKITQIKKLFEEKNNRENENSGFKTVIENLNENIFKLQNDIKSLENKEILKVDIVELKENYNLLDEGIKQYNFLINKLNNEKNKNNNIFFNGKNIVFNIMTFILFCLSLTALIFEFNNKNMFMFSILLIISIIIMIGFIINAHSSCNTDNIYRNEQFKNNILFELKKILTKYDSANENINNDYLPIKIESFKQELNNRIDNYIKTKEQISDKENEITFNKNKLEEINKTQSETIDRINDINTRIEELIKTDNPQYKIDSNLYIDFIQSVKYLKDNILNKLEIEKELNKLHNDNENIIKEFNNFIIENEIKIVFSQEYKENLELLKKYNEENNNSKNNLDLLNVEINHLSNKKDEFLSQLKEKNKYSDISTEEINLKLNEIRENREILLKEKTETEYKKLDLEKFEGLSQLKYQRDLLQEEYRNKISDLIKNKMIIKLTETSKNNFDKIQPDIKNAQKYLSILTNGKYTKINIDLLEISNEDNSVIKKWNELSRGTKEQVYLSLRLGYASNYSKNKTTLESNNKPDLPLIIDDAFVNFDFQRTENAIKCLIEFSKSNQILFFTCHTQEILKHFENINKEIIENIKIINM